MERKIGEIFEYNGEWYQCLKSASCDECAFLNSNCIDNPSLKCSVDDRTDNCSVIFKKLEKVGKPYYSGVHYVQDYKVRIPAKYNGIYPLSFGIYGKENIVTIKIKQNQEDMEEKKLKLKEFDLEKAKAGKPVCTRDGRKARIICFDSTLKNYPLVVLVGDYPYSYTAEGKFNKYSESSSDLMMLSEKKDGWVVIRKGDIYETEELARKALLDSRTTMMIKKITWEE